MDNQRFRLLVACLDQHGLIHRVSGLIASSGGNIVAFDQHSEGLGGLFFMRAEFDAPQSSESRIRDSLAVLAADSDMTWHLYAANRVHRLGVLVSKADHCLLELAWRTQRGDIRAKIAVVISNHRDAESIAAQFGLPFFHVPTTPSAKVDSEAAMSEILNRHDIDTVVLARYMQILSPTFVAQYPNRIINIHHSFLPAFAGANPYRQAYQRGVKLIGATAHYVTAELDAGPIIEQDVHRVDHRHQPGDYQRIGRLVERIVLARAVDWHVTDRVLVYGDRTVVFPI